MRSNRTGDREISYRKLFARLLAFTVLVFFSLFYLGHFITFMIIGPVTVGEENRVILWIEILLCVFIIVLAVSCFIGEIRERGPKNNKEGEGRSKLKAK